MANLLTWDVVDGDDAFDDKSEYIERADNTIRALAQKLADSPCPVCLSEWQTYRECGDEDCQHCGDFPEPRRGHFAIDAPDALRRVSEESYY